MAKGAPPSSLITGILTAFQAAFHEISGAWPRKIISGKYQFSFEKIGPLTICKVIDAPLDSDEYLSEIGLTFIKKYGSQLNRWHGDRRKFSNFSQDLDRLIPQQLSDSLNPQKSLDAFALLDMNEGLGSLSKYIIEHNKKISSKDFHKISKDLDIGVEKLKNMIDKLVDSGYLGYIMLDEEIEYFV